MFSWDETAFVEFFGVMPSVTNEFGRDYAFKITQASVTLVFAANIDMGDCSVLLHCSDIGEPIFRAVYLGSPGARVVNDKRGNFIELGAPGSFSGQYDTSQPLQHGLRISLAPHIQVEAFGA